MADSTSNGINFDTITVETVDITKDGKTWKLRDDVPTSVLARGFRLVQLTEAYGAKIVREKNGQQTLDPAQLERFFVESEAEQVALAVAIFQHTYPEMSDDQVTTLFAPKECEQIAGLFFQRRFNRSASPSSATDPSSAPTEPSAAASPSTASRRSATSRAAEKPARAASGRSRPAATRSPKR